MTERRMAVVIPGALLVCAFVMRSMMRRAPASLTSDLAAPLPVATDWHGFGAMLLTALLVSAVLATVAYGAILSARSDPLSWPAVAGVAFVGLLAAWCAPVLFSSDIYAYAAYGELARLGADPYLHRALPPGNAVFDAAIGQWGNPPPACVYGLSFVWVARVAVSFLHPFGVAMTLHGLRWISSSALLLTAPLAYCAFHSDPSRRVRAAATIALNPVAIWCAAEGHNDPLTIAVMLAGFGLIARGRPGAGGALAAFAGSIKLPAIVAGGIAGRQNRRAVIGAAIGVACAIVSSLPLLRAVRAGMGHPQYAPQASFQAIVQPLLYAWAGGGAAEALTWVLAGVAAAACVAIGIARLRRRDTEGWAYLALGGWLLVPNPYPWYGIWLLPIAAAAPRTRGALALVGLSITALLRYVPDAVGAPGPLFGALLGVAACAPFIVLVPVRASGIMRSRL